MCVIFLRHVEHVAKFVRCCSEQRILVSPQGGNTSTCGGSVPDERGNGIVLNPARINRVIEVNPEDNSITVEAIEPVLPSLEDVFLDVVERAGGAAA